MLTFHIEGRKTSPEVMLDRAKGTIDIKGNSTLKNSSWFYSNVLKWVIAFNSIDSPKTTINIKLNKINQASEKWILLIMKKLGRVVPGNQVIINWYYEPSDTNLQLNGERLKLSSGIPVNLIAA